MVPRAYGTYYGNEKTNIADRTYHKHYSNIFSAEVVQNKQNNTTKFITYLGGDAYSATVLHLKKMKGQSTLEQGFKYLHRDYLGSVMAISNAQGEVDEYRHFGAWGTVDKYWSRTGNASFDYESILQRGYTGHEHFADVDLIHMNGRMYDANLGRFISPDTFVQDPFNTQNYNRYGYAYNNPLMFSDPSGEFFLAAVFALAGALGGGAIATVAAAFIVGGASAVLFNGVANLVNGQSFFTEAGNAFLFGGISGVLSFGVGQINWSNAVFQHAAHGLSGGFMSVLQGGDFGSGFASGFISHAIAAGTDMLVGENSAWRNAAIVASGTLAGGISSKLSGGSWVMGIRQGFASSLFNQVLSNLCTCSPEVQENRDRARDRINELKNIGIAAGVATAVGGQRMWVTYTLYDPVSGTYYVGRTSGYGDIYDVLRRRLLNRHTYIDSGFEVMDVDQYAFGGRYSTGYNAIRGREQQMIDFYGGALSDIRYNGMGTRSANAIRAVSRVNGLGRTYHNASTRMFGYKYRFTGGVINLNR